MPKFRTTNREMTEKAVCYRISYSDLQHLFYYENAKAYTAGVYGWNSDFFQLEDSNTYISTGYRPCGYDISDRWIIKALDNWADNVIRNCKNYDALKDELNKGIRLLKNYLLCDFSIHHQKSWNKEEKSSFKETQKDILRQISELTGYSAE